MSKTLVTPKHDAGPHENGVDDCFSRWSTGGYCPGVEQARWLNALGDDDGTYLSYPRHGRIVTNGEVRLNWIRHDAHIVAVDPERARWLEAKLRAQRDLRYAARKLKQIEATVKQA